jgi:hypothetical protein
MRCAEEIKYAFRDRTDEGRTMEKPVRWVEVTAKDLAWDP